MRTFRTKRFGRMIIVLAATTGTLLAAGCQPINHPNVTTRATPGANANFKMMSGDAQYVVLSATAAGPVVPGAGNWRVNRTSGAVDALPAGVPKAISRDGSRVLVGTNTLWVNGTTSTSTGLLSPDLSARAFVGGDGTVQTQDVVTGVIRPVETDHPRPTGTTAEVLGVSDDGDTVMYHFASTLRIVDLADGSVHDRPYGIAGRTVEYRLSGSGNGLAITDYVATDQGNFNAGVTLVHVPSDTTLATYTDDSASWFYGTTVLASDGGAAWLTHERSVGDGEQGCPSAPFAASCVIASELVHVGTGGPRVFDTYAGDLLAITVTPNGRFATYTKEGIDSLLDPPWVGFGKPGPVHIIDAWSSGTSREDLTAGPSKSAYGYMSANGALVAST